MTIHCRLCGMRFWLLEDAIDHAYEHQRKALAAHREARGGGEG